MIELLNWLKELDAFDFIQLTIKLFMLATVFKYLFSVFGIKIVNIRGKKDD